MRKLAIGIVGCLFATPMSLSAQTAATTHTIEANAAVKEKLNLNNRQDFEDAQRGFIATVDEPAILGDDGKQAYTLKGWDFLKDTAPQTANPSLWRQSQLNRIHGLFEVVPGKIYQIRGYDIANMTFVRTDNGWVIIDVTSANASAKAGYDLIKKHVGNFPVKAVIFTHPHGDHYGGIEAIRQGAPNKDFDIIAPAGFMESSLSENIMAGVAMSRRAIYMFGMQLPPDAKGFVGAGLGQALATGSKGIARPTDEISFTGEKRTIDGLDMEFVYALETEAPVEVMVYLPQLKAFCTAEEMTHNMHNLQTLRGAKVRNGLLWSKCIDKAIELYGDKVEVSFSTHHWPTWGSAKIVPYWEAQRDMYRYLHDQTLHLANKGLTPNEIAEEVQLPASIDTLYHCRGYYGTVSHNVKSQYDLYFGWFDGNPANLNPLPPVEQGKRYVDAMGGSAAVLNIAKTSYDKGDYRWVATLLNNLVFAEPGNKQARKLLIDTYTQLAYQSESAPWRNFYLTGAKDLATDITPRASRIVNHNALVQMDMGMLLDFCAVQLDGKKTPGKEAIINLRFSDTKEEASLILKNGVLNHRLNRQEKEPDMRMELTKKEFIELLFGSVSLKELQQKPGVSLTGRMEAVEAIQSCIDAPVPNFNIVVP